MAVWIELVRAVPLRWAKECGPFQRDLPFRGNRTPHNSKSIGFSRCRFLFTFPFWCRSCDSCRLDYTDHTIKFPRTNLNLEKIWYIPLYAVLTLIDNYTIRILKALKLSLRFTISGSSNSVSVQSYFSQIAIQFIFARVKGNRIPHLRNRKSNDPFNIKGGAVEYFSPPTQK